MLRSDPTCQPTQYGYWNFAGKRWIDGLLHRKNGCVNYNVMPLFNGFLVEKPWQTGFWATTDTNIYKLHRTYSIHRIWTDMKDSSLAISGTDSLEVPTIYIYIWGFPGGKSNQWMMTGVTPMKWKPPYFLYISLYFWLPHHPGIPIALPIRIFTSQVVLPCGELVSDLVKPGQLRPGR